jgi:hypothetical protein
MLKPHIFADPEELLNLALVYPEQVSAARTQLALAYVESCGGTIPKQDLLVELTQPHIGFVDPMLSAPEGYSYVAHPLSFLGSEDVVVLPSGSGWAMGSLFSRFTAYWAKDGSTRAVGEEVFDACAHRFCGVDPDRFERVAQAVALGCSLVIIDLEEFCEDVVAVYNRFRVDHPNLIIWARSSRDPDVKLLEDVAWRGIRILVPLPTRAWWDAFERQSDKGSDGQFEPPRDSWTPSFLILRQGGHDGQRQIQRRVQAKRSASDCNCDPYHFNVC